MKMKLFALLAVVLFVSSLSTVKGDSEGEGFLNVVIPPREKYFDSDGKVALSPKNEHHRSVRHPTTCKIPEDLIDSQLDCKWFPNRVLCTQTCIFGHTLTDGIQREMKCVYDENKWTPRFQDCKPFVDCSVTLNPAGSYKCYGGFLEKGETCEISCGYYEDKEAVPQTKYECDIDGNWSPKLPFCATPGSGLKLVPPPKGPRMITKS